MCTLSIFPIETGNVVSMNRDEALDRQEAGIHSVALQDGSLDYWYPLDAVSGGTWFGVHHNGMVAGLLNRYQDRSSHSPQRSRGEIIPHLLQHGSHGRWKQLLLELEWALFAPFDLVLLMDDIIYQFSWNSESTTISSCDAKTPFMLSSTSADVTAAQHHRRTQFDSFSARHKHYRADDILTQLHLQGCPENPSLGIKMQRPGRATRSICQVEISRSLIRKRYWPLDASANAAMPLLC
jgi:uncharacterized protein with NRDE domain